MIRYEEKLPSVDEYLYLYNCVLWGNRNRNSVEQSLKNSIFGICVYEDNQIIAMSRVIGDETIFLYVHDVIVDPKYQGKGIGKELMLQLVAKLREYQKNYPGMRIYLGAAKNKEEFYEKVGFTRRSKASLGEGMILK